MEEEKINEETIETEEIEEEDNSDYDFDFTIYDQEDETDTEIETIINKERPRITGLRSRFSNGEDELARIGELNRLITKYSIKIESRSQDINDLWEYYGMLSELWEIMRNIFGSEVNNEIKLLKNTCKNLMEECDSSHIDKKVHNNLLYLRSNIYRLKQLSNLGFEVDKMGGGLFGKARRNIEQ